MTVQIIFIIFVVLCMVGLYLTLRKNKYDYVMSIKESLDLCDLPVVTMTNNGKKFNFMLDTGASENHISQGAIKDMESVEINKMLNVQGFNSSEDGLKGHEIKLDYKDITFELEVYISPSLDNTFAWIKKESGVQLHGIIGNKFLVKYGYILDFKKLKVYAKN